MNGATATATTTTALLGSSDAPEDRLIISMIQTNQKRRSERTQQRQNWEQPDPQTLNRAGCCPLFQAFLGPEATKNACRAGSFMLAGALAATGALVFVDMGGPLKILIGVGISICLVGALCTHGVLHCNVSNTANSSMLDADMSPGIQPIQLRNRADEVDSAVIDIS